MQGGYGCNTAQSSAISSDAIDKLLGATLLPHSDSLCDTLTMHTLPSTWGLGSDSRHAPSATTEAGIACFLIWRSMRPQTYLPLQGFNRLCVLSDGSLITIQGQRDALHRTPKSGAAVMGAACVVFSGACRTVQGQLLGSAHLHAFQEFSV